MLKSLALATAMALAGSLAHAVVNPLNSSNTVFLDPTNGLIWTNGNAFASTGKTFTDAVRSVSSLSIDNYSDWRLPTLQEFLSLYTTQGTNGSTMSRNPFTLNANFYWTSDIYLATTPSQYRAFNPNTTLKGQNATFFATTSVGVWAVQVVPEPSVSVLFSVGAAFIATVVLRTQRNRINAA